MRLNKGIKVILTGMVAGILCLLFIYGLYRLPPARIYLGHAGRFADLWPPDGAPLAASLSASQRECHLQYGDHWSTDLFERCATHNGRRNRIILIGNSHAQHLVPMLEAASQDLGYGYTALTISNCRLISAFQVISSINYRYDLCKDYFDNSLDFAVKNAISGDIVLFGARSLFDKPSPNEEDMPSGAYVDGKQLTSREAYVKSILDLAGFSISMRAKGVALVFAGPTPQFALTATQCAPEWFRSTKTGCEMPLRALAAEKESIQGALSEISAKSGNAYFWDPFPALCEEMTCYPSRAERLLFRDQHHLSVYGSKFLAPSFVGFIHNIRK